MSRHRSLATRHDQTDAAARAGPSQRGAPRGAHKPACPRDAAGARTHLRLRCAQHSQLVAPSAHHRRCFASSRSTIPSSRGGSQRREPPRRPSNPPGRLSLGAGTAVREQTHTWGHSLMDLGVGAGRLTGALGRRRASAKPARLSESAWRVCRRHAPLVAIGAGRLIAVKAADYHEVATTPSTHP
jgi:hypothetical protein